MIHSGSFLIPPIRRYRLFFATAYRFFTLIFSSGSYFSSITITPSFTSPYVAYASAVLSFKTEIA